MRDLKITHVEISCSQIDMSSVRIVVHSDASYENLRDIGSQGGHYVFISDAEGSCVLIAVFSKKIRRVVRSTLGAETLSAVYPLDTAYLVPKFLKKKLGLNDVLENDTRLHTDNKRLYDALITSHLLPDTRLRVDISALRGMNDRGELSYY